MSVSDMGQADHKIASALHWMATAIDDDVVALLRPVAERLGENLLADKVKFGAVGLERVRMWERTWKTCSEFGVGCRVSLAIQDREPDTIDLRVNSSPVTAMTVPWNLVASTRPTAYSDKLVPALIVPAGVAIDVWLQNAIVQLRGAPRLPRH